MLRHRGRAEREPRLGRRRRRREARGGWNRCRRNCLRSARIWRRRRAPQARRCRRRRNWVDASRSQIDAAEATLPPLRNFILPGGTEFAARLHVARTVCRRAERLLVATSRERQIDPLIVTYVNRLSDWLFVQARRANHVAGVPDVPWVSA
jgi:cob(I)alamin adenosyltransferase